MFRKLLFIFILIPVIEIALFILVGQWIGVPMTLLFIFLTGLLGAYLMKRQGTLVLREIQFDLQQRRVPAKSGVQGLCILIGGILLLTPGFFSDLCGFLLLFPPTREKAGNLIMTFLMRKIRRGDVTFFYKK